MRLASVLTPFNDENLALAAQCGVEDITVRYPGPGLEPLRSFQDRVAARGMRLAAVEGFLPIEKIKLGRDTDGAELAELAALVENMGRLGIPILCTNFMAGTDWVRTRLDVPERGGATVTAFSLCEAENRARSLNSASGEIDGTPVSAAELWENLGSLLREIVPVAEKAGVYLAMHPDDPPLSEFRGKARILNSVDAFERLVSLVPSPHNGVCFCQGSFASMGGLDIPATIRRLGKHIRYVHFRDARGDGPGDFVETFHDNGPTDMAAAMRAYRGIGFDGPIRADHVPRLHGEDDGEPGYTMKGRLFAWGYIRGLIQASMTPTPGP